MEVNAGLGDPVPTGRRQVRLGLRRLRARGVATVALVGVLDLADGSTTDAEVLAGTLVPGDTMFWANVPGDLTHVTAYDADGDVVDDHAITSCSGGVDCEVR
jgi:hypothetical protein